jgi:hypothetical protein
MEVWFWLEELHADQSGAVLVVQVVFFLFWQLVLLT